MSKASRKKHRQRKHARKAFSTICQKCGAVESATPASLLSKLADAMNAINDAGLALRLRHGIVMTRGGYVLPLKSNRWAARTLNYDTFRDIASPILDDDLEE